MQLKPMLWSAGDSPMAGMSTGMQLSPKLHSAYHYSTDAVQLLVMASSLHAKHRVLSYDGTTDVQHDASCI